MSDRIRQRSSRRRVQLPSSPGRNTKHEPARRQSWAGLSTQEILARYKPGTAPPLKVLDVLIELFNTLHTSLEKTVSHTTRQERAQFLRRFVLGSGSLKALAEEYGVSYPTVRARLDRLIAKVEAASDPRIADPFQRKLKLLVADGQLAAQVARELLDAHRSALKGAKP